MFECSRAKAPGPERDFRWNVIITEKMRDHLEAVL